MMPVQKQRQDQLQAREGARARVCVYLRERVSMRAILSALDEYRNQICTLNRQEFNNNEPTAAPVPALIMVAPTAVT